MARPRKIQWPVSVTEMLRIFLRQKIKRPEDRWKVFREWRRWHLERYKLNRKPTEDELEADVSEWQQGEFYSSDRTYGLMDNLTMDFLPIYRKENRINRARAAAKGRWSKKSK
jgi:hypothetical protein